MLDKNIRYTHRLKSSPNATGQSLKVPSYNLLLQFTVRAQRDINALVSAFISIRFSKMHMQNSTKTSQYNTVTLKIVVLKMNASLAVSMTTGDVRVLKTRSMSDPEVE